MKAREAISAPRPGPCPNCWSRSLVMRSCETRDAVEFRKHWDPEIAFYVVATAQASIEEQFKAERSEHSEQNSYDNTQAQEQHLGRFSRFDRRLRAGDHAGRCKQDLIVAVECALVDGLRRLELQLQLLTFILEFAYGDQLATLGIDRALHFPLDLPGRVNVSRAAASKSLNFLSQGASGRGNLRL